MKGFSSTQQPLSDTPPESLPLPRTQPEKHQIKQKFGTFPYTGKVTPFFTKLFKYTKISIAYRTKNNLLHSLAQSPHIRDIFTYSGAYRLTCPHCRKAYEGQTGQEFKSRFNKHKRGFRCYTQAPKYAQHLATHLHAFGNVQHTMQILQFRK